MAGSESAINTIKRATTNPWTNPQKLLKLFTILLVCIIHINIFRNLMLSLMKWTWLWILTMHFHLLASNTAVLVSQRSYLANLLAILVIMVRVATSALGGFWARFQCVLFWTIFFSPLVTCCMLHGLETRCNLGKTLHVLPKCDTKCTFAIISMWPVHRVRCLTVQPNPKETLCLSVIHQHWYSIPWEWA